ncbi:MAG TPA: hypothetical protein VN541_02310 [Tepidisphaeraceae bacterium]|nr:hypothetical protein [Tepidisphaeraceae bacterium]
MFTFLLLSVIAATQPATARPTDVEPTDALERIRAMQRAARTPTTRPATPAAKGRRTMRPEDVVATPTRPDPFARTARKRGGGVPYYVYPENHPWRSEEEIEHEGNWWYRHDLWLMTHPPTTQPTAGQGS